MPNAIWQAIPTSLSDQWDATDDASQWAADQRAQNAQDWGNIQRTVPQPPIRDDWARQPAAPPFSDSLTNPLGTGSAPAIAPEPAAGGSPAPSPSGFAGPAPAVAPAASTPAPLDPVTAPLAPQAGPDGGDPYWLQLAKQQLGKPYIWGSAGGRSDFGANAAGFDCSGFVSYVMQDGLGIKLPAYTASAYQATTPVSADQAMPGDVVLYNMGDSDPHIQHIAIYLGNGQVIQAGGGGGRSNVNIAPLANAGTYEFRRPAGSPNADLAQRQIANVANSAAPDSARTDSLQHSPVDAVQNWVGGAANAVTQAASAVADAAGGAKDALEGALGNLPSITPQLDPNSPIMQQAQGNPQNPFAVKDQIVQGAADALMPGAGPVPVVKGVLEGAIDPANLPGGVVNSLAQLGLDGIKAAAAPLIERYGARLVGAAIDRIAAVLPKAESAAAVTRDDWATQLNNLRGTDAFQSAKPASQTQMVSDALAQFQEEHAGLYGPAQLNAGLTPQDVGQAAQNAGQAVSSAFQPVANLPDTLQGPIQRFAAVVGPNSRASNVVAENLAQRVRSVLGQADSTQAADLIRNFEQTGEFSTIPTWKQAQLAADLRDYFSSTRQQGVAGGYIRGDVTQAGQGAPNFYFPHLWAEEADQAAGGASRSLSPQGFYSQGRKYLTIDDALAAGKQPLSVSDAVAKYAHDVTDSEAKAQLVRDLQAAQPDSVVAIGPNGEVPEGMVPGSSIDPRINSPLRPFAFDPDAARAIRNVVSSSGLRSNPLGQAILNTTGTAKQTIFTLSNFHTITEALTSYYTSPKVGSNFIRAFVSPSFYQSLRYGGMADTFEQAARAGVTGLFDRAGPDVEGMLGNGLAGRAVQAGVSGIGGAGAGYTQTKLAGGSEDEARKNAAIFGAAGAIGGATVAPKLTAGLWERAVPLAKATAWDALRGRLGDQAAADVVNQRFGGLNYAQMGRSQTLQDVMRLTLMAPDWNEATVRQLATAFFGGQGAGVTREFLARAVLGTTIATEATNWALTGHFTNQNEPGHAFELEVPTESGKLMHVGIGPGNIQAYLDLANKVAAAPGDTGKDVTNFAAGRMSAPAQMVGTVADSLRGNPPYDVKKAGAAAVAQRFAPIGTEQIAQGTESGVSPGEAFLLAALGLNPRYSSAPASTGGWQTPAGGWNTGKETGWH